jgi:hypothetical protein
VYAGSVDIDAAGSVTKGTPPPSPHIAVRDLARYNTIPGGCSNVVVAKEAFTRAGAFDERLGPCADWDMWLRLLRVGPPACVPEALVAYRLHSENMSLSERRMISDFSALRTRYGTMEEATFRRYLFWWSLRRQRRAAALSHWSRAVLARDRSFPRRLLTQDFAYLVRDCVDATLVRGTRGRWTSRRATGGAQALSLPVNPYLLAASAWVAQCD